MCWASVEKIARLVFQMPEAELKLWVDQNKNTLSLAERLHTMSPESLEAEIDELIRNGEIIKKEYASIEN
jgi:hypothetical protein